MKKFLKPDILPLFTIGIGGLGLVLRLWYQAGIDEKGLLPEPHFASIVTFLITAFVLAILFLCTRQLAPIGKFSRLFPAGIGRAVGCGVGGLGILIGGLHFLASGGLGVFTFIVSLAATAAMALLAYLRLIGRRPPMALHTIVTVFYMLFTVCNCRVWGSESQIQAYVFPLLACVSLMLFSYHTTVSDVQKCSRQWLVFFNQTALFFCCLSLGGQARLFYLAQIVFLTLDLCSLQPLRATAASTEEA